MFKEFIYKISKDTFIISLMTIIIFAILEWLEPGFVSYYINFNLLLIIPLISGILTVLFKSRQVDKFVRKLKNLQT